MSEAIQAPDFFSTEKAIEGRVVSAAAADAAAKLREMAQAGKVKAVEQAAGLRSFLAPTAPNGAFLAIKGRVTLAPFQSGVIGLPPATHREGDVWVEFRQGVCSTDDPLKLIWLEAHSGYPDLHEAYHRHYGENPAECTTPIGLCREQGPGIDVWAELKTGQHPTSSRPATISQEIDIDAFMRGDFGKGNRSLSSGWGKIMAEAAESDQAAAAERAQGQK